MLNLIDPYKILVVINNKYCLPSIGILHMKGLRSSHNLSDQQLIGLLVVQATQFCNTPPLAVTGAQTPGAKSRPSSHAKCPSCRRSWRPKDRTINLMSKTQMAQLRYNKFKGMCTSYSLHPMFHNVLQFGGKQERQLLLS
jgi:hypothetical protein